MKQKSLRQLASELGVSHSYLSQVRHGKRPASAKVVSKIVSNDGQSVKQYAKILTEFVFGGVSEMADEHDLGLETRIWQSTLRPFSLLTNSSVHYYLPLHSMVI